MPSQAFQASKLVIMMFQLKLRLMLLVLLVDLGRM